MDFLGALVVCICLWLLFPKGFKYLVGTWIGVITGAVLWGFMAAVDPDLISVESFVAAVAAGIVAGCIFAAKG